ncbi:MAG: methyltransferase domain-containing protein [Akkermansiaceae bacterium]|nr:methyltransferase domain-containing protein [Akkermansiaceae bacterium]
MDFHFLPRPTTLLHDILKSKICSGDKVIDATAGNGHDTVFLAECVGKTGNVLAFDVQEAAIISARERLAATGYSERVGFYQKSHAEMGNHAAPESVSAILFNLGYLPGEDHALTTELGETLRALEIATNLLRSGGVLSVICYPGHPAGAIEAEAVEKWAAALATRGWRIAKYGAIGTRRPAPFLLLIHKFS